MATLSQPEARAGRRVVNAQVLDELLDLAAEKLADRAEQRLDTETIARMEREAIERRVSRLSLEEARIRLQCRSVRALKELCRQKGIAIRRYSRERQYVLISDIERADEVNREGAR